MRKPRSEYPSEQSDKFLVRLPPGMRDQIAEAAKSNGRSMNAEIVQRLEGSFEQTSTSREQEEAANVIYGEFRDALKTHEQTILDKMDVVMNALMSRVPGRPRS